VQLLTIKNLLITYFNKINTLNPEEFKRLLKEFAPKQILVEADVIPLGPGGEEITDKLVIKNLNMAVKAVDSALRPKLIDLITDPGAAKSLKNPAQRAAIIGAIAIAFGISEQEFTQIVGKIKGVLKKAGATADDQT